MVGDKTDFTGLCMHSAAIVPASGLSLAADSGAQGEDFARDLTRTRGAL